MESPQNDSPEFFSGLDKQILTRIAEEWAEEYPVIKRVTLFRARARENFEYVLLVQYDENESEELDRFRRWSFGHENCGHVIAELADAYKLPFEDLRYKDEWIWIQEPLGTEFSPESVIQEQSMVLYEQESSHPLLFNHTSEEAKMDESFEVVGKINQIWVQIEQLRRMPTNSIMEEETRVREMDEKTQEYNALEFYYVWDNEITRKCDPEPLTRDGQKRIVDEAVSNGFIGLGDLVYLLAADKQYQDLLPSLWRKYQCDVRGSKSPDVSTPRSRVGLWQALLFRWAHGMVGGIRGGLRPIPYLPLHCFDVKTGRYEKRDSKDFIESRDNGPEYIGLDDLRKYLTEVIRTPLPRALFPEAFHPKRQPSEELDRGLQGRELQNGKHEERGLSVEKSEVSLANDDEDFIKALRVSNENDYEIMIQEPGKKAVNYNHTRLGFQTQGKTWKDLLVILKDPDYCYNLGASTADSAKKRDYYARRKRLEEINKKFVIFLNKEFSLTLPKGYKLYGRDKTKRHGTYAFRFLKASAKEDKSLPKTKFDNFDGDKLLAELEKLALKYNQLCTRLEDTDAAVVREIIISAARSGLARGVVSGEQIKDVLVEQRTNIDISKVPTERLFYAEDSQE